MKNAETAYNHLFNGLMNGVSFFDEATAYFNDNYDVLAPIFVRQNNYDVEVTDDKRKEILNMHDA